MWAADDACGLATRTAGCRLREAMDNGGLCALLDPMQPAPFLQIQDIVKDFDGHRAVDHVSIDIAKGEVFALLGSSGPWPTC